MCRLEAPFLSTPVLCCVFRGTCLDPFSTLFLFFFFFWNRFRSGIIRHGVSLFLAYFIALDFYVRVVMNLAPLPTVNYIVFNIIRAIHYNVIVLL